MRIRTRLALVAAAALAIPLVTAPVAHADPTFTVMKDNAGGVGRWRVFYDRGTPENSDSALHLSDLGYVNSPMQQSPPNSGCGYVYAGMIYGSDNMNDSISTARNCAYHKARLHKDWGYQGVSVLVSPGVFVVMGQTVVGNDQASSFRFTNE